MKLFAGGRGPVLVASSLGGFCDGLDASIFVIALFPAISSLLSTQDHTQVAASGAFILAVFMVGWALGAIVFGILSDYIGRVRTMVITILLYAICTGLCAFAQNVEQLAICRFLVGCGIGGEMGAGAILLAEYWRGNSRLHAAGVMSAFITLGYMSASLLNLVFGEMSWRLIFLAGALPALVTLYIRAQVQEPASFVENRASLGQGTFTARELFAGLNLRKTLIVMAMASTAIVTWWAALAWIPAWVNQLTGELAVFERSTVYFFLTLGGLFACFTTGFLISRIGRAWTFRLAFSGTLITAEAMFLFVNAVNPLLLILCVFVGFFAVTPFVALNIFVPEIFDARIRGTAFGFSVQTGRICAAVAAIAGAQIVALFGGSYASAGACLILLNGVGLIATFFMGRVENDLRLEHELPGCEANSKADASRPVPEMALNRIS